MLTAMDIFHAVKICVRQRMVKKACHLPNSLRGGSKAKKFSLFLCATSNLIVLGQ